MLVFVCLSVCLSVSKITQKRHLDEMLRVDRCRDMDELIKTFDPDRAQKLIS